MHTRINLTATAYRPERAAKLCAMLQASDPDWTYTVENPAGPWCTILVQDEAGEELGHL